MKIGATAAIATAMVGAAWPETVAPLSTETIVVSISGGPDWTAPDVSLVGRAQRIASTMFAKIGVSVDWRVNPNDVPAEAIAVRLDQRTPVRQHPGALAYALPNDGRSVVVLYDRIKQRRETTRAVILLAHVLVHEITHILQGVARHSASGIMKANWDDTDFWKMMQKPLEFAAVDVDLVHKGLLVRAARLNRAKGAEVAALTAP